MTGRIPQDFIDEVLRRTDIVDLIGNHVRLKKSGKNYSACCPFHHEKTPSFSVNREKQFYHCFGCGASGNALSFVLQYERRDFIDGLRYLAQKVGLELPDTGNYNEQQTSRQPLYDMLETAAQFYEDQLRQHPQRQKAIDYLQERGLTGQVAKEWRLGYAPAGWDNLLNALGNQDEDKIALLKQVGLVVYHETRQSHYDAMRDRIIFPIRDFRGRVIAFGGRVLDDSKPKYLNSPESPVFHKSEELYGLYETRQAKQELKRIMVVEGYMDVIAVHQAGLPFAVATLGTATSTTHVERLFRSISDVVFCFDGDNAGRRAAWRALENALPALKDGVSANFLFLPEEHDPDSLIRAEGVNTFSERLQQAEPLADFLFRQLSEGLRLESLEGRSKLASQAKPLLEKVPTGFYQQLLWQKLAELTQVDTRQLQPPAAVLKPSASSEEPAPLVTRPVRARYHLPRLNTGHFTLSDKAIQLLLQKPSAAQGLPLAQLEQQLPLESGLLLTVLTYCQEYPDVSSIAILGAWEGSDEGNHIKALLEDTCFIPSLNVETELNDILRQLQLQHLRSQLQSVNSLTEIQRLKAELRRLEQANSQPK